MPRKSTALEGLSRVCANVLPGREPPLCGRQNTIENCLMCAAQAHTRMEAAQQLIKGRRD